LPNGKVHAILFSATLPENGERRRNSFMTKVCDLCGWEYNEEEGYPDGGIEPGTKWEDLPDDFVCPLCGAGKDEFSDAG
jgi:rubredoxin-NAD+ reductase